MHRTRLLSVVGLCLSAAVLSGSQAAPPALSEPLRAHLKSGRFDVITSVRGLPLGVRDLMQKMFGGSTLDIAEPGTEYQATDVILKPGLSIRRMVSASCSTEHYCLLYYERGGIARTHRVMLFRWTPDATRFEWGGTAPAGLRTIDEVRKAVLSGAIKSSAGPW